MKQRTVLLLYVTYDVYIYIIHAWMLKHPVSLHIICLYIMHVYDICPCPEEFHNICLILCYIYIYTAAADHLSGATLQWDGSNMMI